MFLVSQPKHLTANLLDHVACTNQDNSSKECGLFLNLQYNFELTLEFEKWRTISLNNEEVNWLGLGSYLII